MHNQEPIKQCHTFPEKLAVTSHLWIDWPAAWLHGSWGATSEPSLQVSWRSRRDCGRGLCQSQTEGHWGSTGTCPGKWVNGVPLQLFQEGSILIPFLRRNYSEKEVLTSWEGCMSLHERGDPRLLRSPRHKRKQERETFCSCHESGLWVTLVYCAWGTGLVGTTAPANVGPLSNVC